MIFTRSLGVESVSGPLGIIDMGGKVAQAGLVKFLFFLAIISANLAVINFLPLPIVDGGLMVFLIIEKIKGSPVSMKVQVATQVVRPFFDHRCVSLRHLSGRDALVGLMIQSMDDAKCH